MGMISGLIGGGISAVGGLISGNQRKQGYKALMNGYKEQQQLYNDRLAAVKAHRDAVYYADPLQSAETQAAITNAQTVLDDANKRARAVSAVSGGTDESAALAKAQSAATVGNMMQQAAVNGQSRKDTAWNTADSETDTFTKYLSDAKLGQAKARQGQSEAQAQSIQGAAAGLAQSANSLPW